MIAIGEHHYRQRQYRTDCGVGRVRIDMLWDSILAFLVAFVFGKQNSEAVVCPSNVVKQDPSHGHTSSHKVPRQH